MLAAVIMASRYDPDLRAAARGLLLVDEDVVRVVDGVLLPALGLVVTDDVDDETVG